MYGTERRGKNLSRNCDFLPKENVLIEASLEQRLAKFGLTKAMQLNFVKRLSIAQQSVLQVCHGSHMFMDIGNVERHIITWSANVLMAGQEVFVRLVRSYIYNRWKGSLNRSTLMQNRLVDSEPIKQQNILINHTRPWIWSLIFGVFFHKITTYLDLLPHSEKNKNKTFVANWKLCFPVTKVTATVIFWCGWRATVARD